MSEYISKPAGFPRSGGVPEDAERACHKGYSGFIQLISHDAHFTTLSVMLEGYCVEWWTSLWARMPCDSL